MLIGVDVDQTIVPSCTLWEEWLLHEYYIDIKNDHYTKPFEKDEYLIWWKDKYLYDYMLPFSFARKYINLLAKEHTIYFITKCFDEHIESKMRFCNKYFNGDRFFNTGFNKADAFDSVLDYMIDDRPSILREFKNTKCFRINTTVEPETDEFPLVSWEQIYKEIKKE